MAGRKRASDERIEEKRAAIGKTAVQLFRAKGYLETSMQDISRACKMSKGGIYHYFAGKDRILFFVLTGYMDRILEGLEEDLAAIATHGERIRFVILRHIRLYTRYQAEAKTLLHDANCLPRGYFNVVADKERKYYRIVSGVLDEFFDRTMPKEELTAATFLLFGMCNWIYSWYDPKGPVTPNDLAEMIYGMFMKGCGSVGEGNEQ